MSKPAQSSARRTLSLRSLLTFGFGGLVALSVGGVLVMSLLVNFSNTFSLLNRQSVRLIEGMERSIRDEAEAAERALAGLAELYAQGEFEIGDPASQTRLLKALLLTVREVESFVVYDREGRRSGLARMPHGEIVDLSAESGARLVPESAMPGYVAVDSPRWSEPVFHNGVLFHNFAQALARDRAVEGVAVAAVGAHTINRIVEALGKDNETTAFVLNESGAVIAHSRLPQIFRGRRSIPLGEFPDDALRRLPSAEEVEEFAQARMDGRVIRVARARRSFDSPGYVFITKEVAVFSPRPYTIGAYFDAADIGTELRRAALSGVVGLAALALALLAAVVFGNHLSKPLRRIAAATAGFADLDLESYEPLPRSRIREIDAQARAMNAMHTALREFGRYVPKKLVERLLRSGTEATRSVERDVTVMFTDIAGFTAMSEQMTAGEVVRGLNDHFELVCSRIGTSRGTVDKFMGDGIMAFWGAPIDLHDHARHALEAAALIAEAFEADNARRRARGEQPFKLRIGIHSGRAIVGNIGGGDRHNYTVVGDTVNVANRLQQLGKELMDGRDVIVLVSDACRVAAGDPECLTSAGAHGLRGRAEPVQVHILDHEVGEGDESAGKTASRYNATAG